MTNAPRDPLSLDAQFCFAVYSTAHALNRTYKPLLDRLGITYPQYLVLLVLWERDDRSVGEIGEKLLLDSSTLTPLLKRLEAAGIVRRERNPEDERQVRIRLTEQGRVMRETARDFPESLLCATGCDVETLTRLKTEMLDVRDRMLGASTAG
ncbi:MarR family winged helix-turn-helix transcriptional regulator [Sphingomonas sp. LaA6.9]|uniref:MarR family winged helix-turn-helix transcriptional regulator n=1 Tax=Sphingomonas sp. LaA6.9 TaxID=2919914 RepID=UPI001F503DE2|nr:MarR family transcriptional regulator [Sphingomonas sp. LaA6.9]MCJ8156420.1 MarR family transcriptional regulator [Sphingomonas sp. LaA6.9]